MSARHSVVCTYLVTTALNSGSVTSRTVTPPCCAVQVLLVTSLLLSTMASPISPVVSNVVASLGPPKENSHTIYKGKITHRSWAQLPPEIIRSVDYFTPRAIGAMLNVIMGTQACNNTLHLGCMFAGIRAAHMGSERELASAIGLYHSA